MIQDGYDIFQICENGHPINSFAKSFPLDNQNFCSKCGTKTIMQCQNCNSSIRGSYNSSMIVDSSVTIIPSFCINCGKPFPWTLSKIEAANELTNEFDELTEVDKEILKKSLPDLINESPRTTLAETRFKKIMSKVKKESGDAMRKIIIDIISETVKKSLFGNQ